MKNKNVLYVGLALLIGLLGGYAINQFKVKDTEDVVLEVSEDESMVGRGWDDQPNRGNCLADDCLLVENLDYPVGELPVEVEQALDEAIDDEYKALATYREVVSKFGVVRPFSMIIGAEEQHIASLKAIYDKYGLEVPSNPWLSKVTVPATLQEACQVGVKAEIANAALYREKLLPLVKDYEDITAVFESLMKASLEKHLPAFEKCD